jgi:hypothetical protein
MATLAGQRAQFTWALNQYNASDDPETKDKFARRMAKYIAAAPRHGFAPEAVTQGQSYPAEAVIKHLSDTDLSAVEDQPEAVAIAELQNSVDCSDVIQLGAGAGTVYVYGYRCAPDRVKIGMTTGDAVQRVAEQIWTSTPDRPVLLVEMKTDRPRSLEKAIQSVLDARGLKVEGGGGEWYKTHRVEILSIAEFIFGKSV